MRGLAASTAARRNVVRHINTTMTLAYWLIGRRIVVEEQKGNNRAAYGERLLKRISRELGAEFGNGFGEPHLRNCRLFYKAYPTETEIRYALRIKLTWTHHRAIMRVQEPKARAYYLKEAEEQGWDTRELERQIRMFAYERVVANQVEPDASTAGGRQELTPEMLLKDPCVAEFLDLRENLRGKERKVEKRIIDHILRCFVLVDLKTAKLTSRDIGQMDAYRRMFDALKRQEGDAQTIGILLGTEIDEPEVKYSIMAECERIFATKLMPFLPTKAELQCEIERGRRRANLKKRPARSAKSGHLEVAGRNGNGAAAQTRAAAGGDRLERNGAAVDTLRRGMV